MNGMDDEEDENDFSDSEFEGLDDQTLLALEREALLSTEQTQPFRENGYTRSEVSRPGAWNGQVVHEAGAPIKLHPDAPRHGQLEDSHDGTVYADSPDVATPVEERDSFTYPQDVPGEMTQREQWRQQRYSKPLQQLVNTGGQYLPAQRPACDTKQLAYQNNRQMESAGNLQQNRSYSRRPDESLLEEDPVPLQQQHKLPQYETLQPHLEDSLRKHNEVSKALQETKSTMEKQQGEISILRAKHANEVKVLERQVTAIKKALQEDSVRHKEKLELVQQEKSRNETELRSVKQDLFEEAQRVKNLRRKLQERLTSASNEPTTVLNNTPKKAHVHSLRDGFDDDEILALSPIKSGSGRRSKGSTPTGAKRKRKAVDVSPVPALVLRQSGVTPSALQEEAVILPKPDHALPIIKKDKTAERNLKFMQRILDHRNSRDTDRILETCMQYAFPTEPSKTFTALILAATARLSPSGKRFKADILAVFVNMWATCLREKYYKPIPLVMEVVCFIIALESEVIDDGIIILLLPVLQNCGKINAEARFNYSPIRQRSGKQKQIPQSELKRECDGTRCLEMLYDLASRCQNHEKLIELFWRSMDTDFVFMMLNSSQPISDMTLMLNLLSTSVLLETFGNICSTAEEQIKMETYIIRRICYLLWETPRVDEGLSPPTKAEICHLRLEVMGLLEVLVFTSAPHPHADIHHGNQALADHPDALARLVRSIYDEVDLMYMHRLSYPLHVQLVNRGINLLYHLLQLHPSISLPQKLSAVNGGVHKHRVVLTRLAFSEGVYLDAGISDETVGMARDMLEESVTPEEAEGLLEAFPEFARRIEPRGSQIEMQEEM